MLILLRILFSPVEAVYSIIVKLRNIFFDKRVFKITRVNADVISVGNITIGGSGKTPAVMFLTDLLKQKNKSVGVLSRGYGRNSRGYIFVSDGTNMKSTVDECGDEMFFLSEELKVPTAVIADSGVKIIILDDAFQHRWIHRDLDLLMMDQQFLEKVGKVEQTMLPLGLMRENFTSMNRADAVIINRKFSQKIEIPEELEKYFRSKKIFHCCYEANGFYDIKTHKFFNVQDFEGQKSLVVCGVARPYSFLECLEKNNIDITNKLIYPDHKNYTLKEIQGIRKKFYDTNSYSVLTTQKDAVKLNKFSNELDDIDIYYLKIELKLDEQDKFEELILSIIK